MDFCSTSSSKFKSPVKLKHKLNSAAKSKEVGVPTDPLRPRICQQNKLSLTIEVQSPTYSISSNIDLTYATFCHLTSEGGVCVG